MYEKAVNLHKREEVEEAAENIIRQGFKPDVIFFDTLFHSAIGANFSEPEDMVNVVLRARWLIREVGARAGFIAHHTPKDGKSLFGTNALLASVDVLWLSEVDKGQRHKAILSCERMKGARMFEPLQLSFQSMKLAVAPNSWGTKEVEQLVLDMAVKAAAKEKTKEDQDLEEMEFNLETMLGNGATNGDWFRQMQKWTSHGEVQADFAENV